MNILIGTPAYNSLVHTDYLHTIINLKIPFTLITIGNESLITRARNKIFSIFINHKKFDYLLFLDSDVLIKTEDIIKLINISKQYDIKIMGAPVPLKHPNKKIFNYKKKENATHISNSIFEVDRIGTAVMLINRSIINSIIQECDKNKDYYFHESEYSRGYKLDKIKIYDVFKVGVFNNEYLSEDYYFCKLCNKLGYKVFVDESITVLHNGMLSI